MNNPTIRETVVFNLRELAAEIENIASDVRFGIAPKQDQLDGIADYILHVADNMLSKNMDDEWEE